MKIKPKVRIFWFQNRFPSQLNGDVVIVDAYAATTNMCVLLSKKPRHLIVVNENNLSQARKIYPKAILVGESDLLGPGNFVVSNQLSEMRKARVKNKNVLWMSINGSRLVEKVMSIRRDGQVIAGSFANMKCLADHLRRRGKQVVIVLAGNRLDPVIEDLVCGEAISDLIAGRRIDWPVRKKKVKYFVKKYYLHGKQNVDYLVDEKYWNEFRILPVFVNNSKGYIEVISEK